MTNTASRTEGRRRVRDRIRDMLATGSPQAGTEYFVQSFVTAAMAALGRARREANLTQEEVARRLNTRQPAIARWESDLSGAISIEHYARFAAACGMIPLDPTLVPMEKLREYVLSNGDAARTADAYANWSQVAQPSLQQPTVQASGPSYSTVISSFNSQEGPWLARDVHVYVKQSTRQGSGQLSMPPQTVASTTAGTTALSKVAA